MPGPRVGAKRGTRQVAAHPTAAPIFDLHVTTAADDAKVVDGHQRNGGSDLVLHFAVARATGRLLGPGIHPAEVFAPVPDDLIVAQLATELRWGAEHAAGEYAVLNACRAWKFAVDGTLVSKMDGGRWALSRAEDADRDLIMAALDRPEHRLALCCWILGRSLRPNPMRRLLTERCVPATVGQAGGGILVKQVRINVYHSGCDAQACWRSGRCTVDAVMLGYCLREPSAYGCDSSIDVWFRIARINEVVEGRICVDLLELPQGPIQISAPTVREAMGKVRFTRGQADEYRIVPL